VGFIRRFLDQKSMGGSLAGVWRRRGAIGIVPSLLMASLLAVVAAVVIVQSSTLHSIILSEQQAAQERLDVNLGMLRHELLGRGSDWRLGADGRLMVDGKVAERLDQESRTSPVSPTRWQRFSPGTHAWQRP
jgi:hypothetical protein